MKRKLVLILLVISLAVIAGCTQRKTQIDSNNGLRINDFSVDPDIAESGDVIKFFLDIENMGGTTAECVKAQIYGVDGWSPFSSIGTATPYIYGTNTFGLSFNYADKNNFQICSANIVNLVGSFFTDRNLPSDRLCYGKFGGSSSLQIGLNSYVGNVWNQFITSQFCQQWDNFWVKSFGSLTPPYPDRNRPGQSVTTDWLLRPPDLPQGLRVSYPVTARVIYAYHTSANVNIRAFNKAEYERRRNSGQETSFSADLMNANGVPIKVALIKETSPVIVNERALRVIGAQSFELANYQFEFQNVGDGWPLPIGDDVGGENGFIFGTVQLRGPGVTFYDCLGYTGGNEIFLGGAPLAKLRSNSKAPFSCNIAIDRSLWVNRPTDTISLIFDLYYLYYIDKETEVTVLGREFPVGGSVGVGGGSVQSGSFVGGGSAGGYLAVS